MNAPQPPLLTPEGRARRDAMLDHLRGLERRVQRRRRFKGGVLAVLLVAAVVPATRLALSPPARPGPPLAHDPAVGAGESVPGVAPIAPPHRPAPPLPPEPSLADGRGAVTIVTTEARIAERLAVSGRAVERLNDEGLARMIRSAGMPGIVVISGRVISPEQTDAPAHPGADAGRRTIGHALARDLGRDATAGRHPGA